MSAQSHLAPLSVLLALFAPFWPICYLAPDGGAYLFFIRGLASYGNLKARPDTLVRSLLQKRRQSVELLRLEKATRQNIWMFPTMGSRISSELGRKLSKSKIDNIQCPRILS